jgi:hypothetical protein
MTVAGLGPKVELNWILSPVRDESVRSSLFLIGALLPTLAQDVCADDSPAESSAVSFSRDVEPVLTRLGCNGGACHGSFQGRGGLRLSLWGFDPQADYAALVSDARGRRIFAGAPETSLFLLKPTLGVPHAGGRRLEAGAEAYNILKSWIEQGLARPGIDDPTVAELHVEPAESVLQPGNEVSLRVTATWSGGESRDVTRWSRFESRSEPVATITPEGRVTAVSAGRSIVTVLFGGQAAAIPVTIPSSEPSTLEFRAYNFIDEHLAGEWNKLGIAPASDATDTEFVRRAYLDIIGTLPTPDEVREFLSASNPHKREQLIDALLARPEYADFWALQWSDRLKIHRRSLGEKGLASFNGWLKQALRDDRPFDEIVRELLVAQGNLYTSGPVAFYFVDQTPEALAETTAQVFLGVRLQCAKCHHHPFEVWSQDDYYGLAACFARVQRKDTKEGGRYGGAQAVTLAAAASVTNPATGAAAVPSLLGTPLTDLPATSDERAALAAWLTDPANPYFARNVVNRYWGDLFGRGLVEPVDDFRGTNPASHPQLLDQLAADFIEHGYDVKRVIRLICTSHTYQLAAEIAPHRDLDGQFVTHRIPRRLPAEVLLDAVNEAVGVNEPFDNFPVGTRAIALPDPAVTSYFLDVFGRPLRVSGCECERVSRVDLRQVLRLANSDALQTKLSAADGRVAKLVASGQSDEAIIEEFYLSTLSRLPTREEASSAAQYVATSSSRQEGLEDVLWTLLNLPEFVFNH